MWQAQVRDVGALGSLRRRQSRAGFARQEWVVLAARRAGVPGTERRGELPAAGTAQQVGLNWFGLGNVCSVPCVPAGASGEPSHSSGRGFLCRTSHLLEKHQLHLQPKAVYFTEFDNFVISAVGSILN